MKLLILLTYLFRKPTGKWTHGSWAPCSVSCGEGTKKRIVACTKDGTNLIINEKFCKGRKPKAIKKCTRTPCKKERGIWVFGLWGRVSFFSLLFFKFFTCVFSVARCSYLEFHFIIVKMIYLVSQKTTSF